MAALAELDRLIGRGVRIVYIRPAPVPGALWARLEDAGIPVAFHLAYYEEDMAALAELIGVDRLVFGSDSHGEGLAEPTDFVKELAGFGADDVRRIMRDDALELLGT